MTAITSSYVRSNLIVLGLAFLPIAADQIVQRVFAKKTSPLKLQVASLMTSAVVYLILAQKLPTSFRVGAPVLYLVCKVALQRWSEEYEDDEVTFPGSTSVTTPPPVASPTTTRQDQDDELLTVGSTGETTTPPDSSTMPKPRRLRRNVELHKTKDSTNEVTPPPVPSTTSEDTATQDQDVVQQSPPSIDGDTPPIIASAPPPSSASGTLEGLPPSAVETLGKVSLGSIVMSQTGDSIKYPLENVVQAFDNTVYTTLDEAEANVRAFEKFVIIHKTPEKRTIKVKSSPIGPGAKKTEEFKANISFLENHLFKFDKARVTALNAEGCMVKEDTLFFWIEVIKKKEKKKLTTVSLIPLERLETVDSTTKTFSLTLKDEDTQYVLNFNDQMTKLRSFAAAMKKCTQIKFVPNTNAGVTLSLVDSPSKHPFNQIKANQAASLNSAKCYLEPFMKKV